MGKYLYLILLVLGVIFYTTVGKSVISGAKQTVERASVVRTAIIE